jgi:peptidoglycan/xylan/chitin deacetylase (PgdA/CDA1 family)
MIGTFVLSLDKELVWGSVDHTPVEEWRRRHPDARGVVRELLALLDEFAIPATWAVVGHLFLRSCARGPDGRAHPELPRPRYHWHAGDWLAADPCSDVERAPLFYAPDVVDAILAARAGHEIGSHSFSHLVYGDPGCPAEAADGDLAACVAAARARGLELRSFVFPRNREGHHDLLRARGFRAYRGEEPHLYRRLPRPARRAAHFADHALGLAAPTVAPAETLPGLWNVPGSMMLFPRGGLRDLIPVAARVRKARATLARAVGRGEIFHLWFHPFNLHAGRAAMFAGLREILRAVAGERDRGRVEVRTMGEIATLAACQTTSRSTR